jgi:periplasmic divalent cation tolerance protein
MSSLMSRPYPRADRFHVWIAERLAADQDGSVDEEFCEVVVTADDAEWLARFTRTLVAEGLAACGHLSPIRSVYRWEGAVQDGAEARVGLHTRRSLVPEIVARAAELHPYDVPCVIALPLVGGSPDYLGWLAAETRSPSHG